MSMIGLLGLLVAFAGCVISVLCLGVAHILYKKRSFERSETFAWGGRVAAVLVAAALTVWWGLRKGLRQARPLPAGVRWATE